MESLERLLADISDTSDLDEIAQHLMELLATVPIPGYVDVEVPGDGGMAAWLVASPDPNEPVQVRVRTASGAEVQASFTQMDARARLNAAAVIQVSRQLAAGLFSDLLAELQHQEDEYRRGRDPVHPDQRSAAAGEFAAGADAHAESFRKGYEQALSEMRAGQVECEHGGMPPADSVEPFGFRACPNCGRRMRAYPASAGGPEWRVAL